MQNIYDVSIFYFYLNFFFFTKLLFEELSKFLLFFVNFSKGVFSSFWSSAFPSTNPFLLNFFVISFNSYLITIELLDLRILSLQVSFHILKELTFLQVCSHLISSQWKILFFDNFQHHIESQISSNDQFFLL